MLEELDKKIEKEIKKLSEKENLSAEEITILFSYRNKIMSDEEMRKMKEEAKEREEEQKKKNEEYKEILSKICF